MIQTIYLASAESTTYAYHQINNINTSFCVETRCFPIFVDNMVGNGSKEFNLDKNKLIKKKFSFLYLDHLNLD